MRTWASLLMVALLLACPAQAHRLDEYLQATIVSIDRHQIELKLYLTAGANSAPAVLARIDTNADRAISAAEQQAYVARVRRDLAVRLDDRPLVLRPLSASFPDARDAGSGLAEVRIDFTAPLPDREGVHRLSVLNRHRTGADAYLVNALQPSDAHLHILSQARSPDQSSYELTFSSGAASPSGPDAGSRAFDGWSVVATYARRGVGHILTGYDHLLFVAALVLAAPSLWSLVKVITAFTLAHSLTLALATFGLIHVPAWIVEPAIAASIVIVAIQNLLSPAASQGGGRLLVAFGFGLMHGLGFASGLLELMHQLPTSTALLALLGFSVGIEAGNQVVLLPLFAALRLYRRGRHAAGAAPYSAGWPSRAASCSIALAGAWMLCAALIRTT